MEVVAQRIGRVLELQERASGEVQATPARLLHDTRQRTGERRFGNAFDRDTERDGPTFRAHDDAPASRFYLPHVGPRDVDRLLPIDAEAELLECYLELLLRIAHDDRPA